MFLKKYETTSPILNLIILNEPQSTYVSRKNCRAKWTGGTSDFGKCGLLLHMCLKYNMGALKSHSKDANY